jgi:hypothetical protein
MFHFFISVPSLSLVFLGPFWSPLRSPRSSYVVQIAIVKRLDAATPGICKPKRPWRPLVGSKISKGLRRDLALFRDALLYQDT